MNSNSTALVEAKINDKLVLIDFLHGIIGVQRKEFDKGIAVIQIKAQDGQLVEVPLLHPVLCLKSRFANMISMATRRRDEIATRQTHTAVKVLKVHISEALKDGDHKEAVTCLQELLHYLESDHFGRNAHIDPGIDALDIAKLFVNDAGLKQIWRERSLIPAIDRIEAKRAERAQRIQAREH